MKRRYFVGWFLATVLIVHVQALTEEQKMLMEEVHKQCMAETGASADALMKALDGEFPEDNVFKKHTLCFLKKVGFITDSGDVQADHIKMILQNSVDQAQYDEIVANCLETKDSPEDTAFEMAKCMHKNSF